MFQSSTNRCSQPVLIPKKVKVNATIILFLLYGNRYGGGNEDSLLTTWTHSFASHELCGALETPFAVWAGDREAYCLHFAI